MPLDWSNERYVRIYTRDTGEWLELDWRARCLFWELNRKCDRAGLIHLGKPGLRAIAVLIRAPWEEIEPWLKALLADGCIKLSGDSLFIPNHTEAQEAPQSDRQRQAESRARRREKAAAQYVDCHDVSHGVTPAQPSLDQTRYISPHSAARVFDFLALYELYPNKKGKRKGLEKLQKRIRTQEQYDAVRKGILAFVAECRRNNTEKRFYPYFSSFINQSRWEDYQDAESAAKAHAQDTRATLRKIDEARKQAAPPDPATLAELERISKL